MNISKFEIILFVSDQQKSRTFYSTILGKPPDLDVPGMTEFDLADDLKLGLMPETGIAKILSGRTPHPSSGNGIPRCELYLHTDDIDASFGAALKAGAKEVSKIEDRDWGDTVGYLADPDGHIIAFASKI
jgi:catechol 2,3-dioxygenase-like lactoylglutathione lyase family enzyme